MPALQNAVMQLLQARQFSNLSQKQRQIYASNRQTAITKVGDRERGDTRVKSWRPGGDEPHLGNQTAGERSRTKGVIDEAVFHSLDCARGRVSPGADTRCAASHRDLITAALTSANRLWNMERNTARPCPCEAVRRAGMKPSVSRNVLPSVLYQIVLTQSSKYFHDEHLEVNAIFFLWDVVLIVVTKCLWVTLFQITINT